MSDCRYRRRAAVGGFSLIELAVVLLVVGLLGVATWRFLPDILQVSGRNAAQQRLAAAEGALIGYARLKGHLPCPDVNGDGKGDCTVAGKPVTVGQLPVEQLGLPQADHALKYGVSRVGNKNTSQDADLTALLNRYQPLIPVTQPTPVTPMSSPTATIIQPLSMQENKNGLDFCVALRNLNQYQSQALHVGSGGGAIPVAFALADPGLNHKFDGLDQSGFALPTDPQTPQFDDRVVAMGVPQIMGSLDCAGTLSKVQGAAHSAFAAYYVFRYAQDYDDYRGFMYTVAASDAKDAGTALALSIADFVGGVGSEVVTIVDLVHEPTPQGGIELAATSADVVKGGVELGDAVIQLNAAIADRDQAKTQAAAANNYLSAMTLRYMATWQRAQLLDKKGLIQ